MEDLNQTRMKAWDWVVVAIYFVTVLAIGFWSSKRSKNDSISGYFLASRNMHWIPVGASLFASNIGSGHFIGLAGSGAASGIGVGSFEINSTYILILLGWVFLPVYLSSGVYTMPEYLRERFGGQRIRIYLSVVALLLYVFTKISVDLYAGAIFIQEALGDSSQEWLYISVLILLGIAAIFTISGGLTAVIWTDFIQIILMIVGAFILMFKAFAEVGGFDSIPQKYPYAVATNFSEQYRDCARPPDYAMNLFRSPIPGESDLPWVGMVFGISVLATWYWCSDQVTVQRTLASKNLTHAKAGCTLVSALKMLPLFLLVFPGMCARILYPNDVACIDPRECKRICGSEGGCTNIAYIKLVLELLPQGLRGLMLAVMMAALMSSLTSIFNSTSTIFTIDIWQRIRRKSWKKMHQRTIELEQVIIGRFCVIFLVIISVIWIPVIQSSNSSQLYVYIQSIQSFLSPPICCVYLVAIFWKRASEPGAFWGLTIGMAIGMTRFIMEFSYSIPSPCSGKEDPRPEIIKLLVGKVHYLHFSILLFFITLCITAVISLVTEPIPDKCLHRLTFGSRFSNQPRVSVREWRNEKIEHVDILVQDNSHQPDYTATNDSNIWHVLYYICGMGVSRQKSLQGEDKKYTKTPEEMAKEAAESVFEDVNSSRIVDSMAIVCLCAATFLFGFYA